MTIRITSVSFDGPDANPGTIRAILGATGQTLKVNGSDPGPRYIEGTVVDAPKMLAAPVAREVECKPRRRSGK